MFTLYAQKLLPADDANILPIIVDDLHVSYEVGAPGARDGTLGPRAEDAFTLPPALVQQLDHSGCPLSSRFLGLHQIVHDSMDAILYRWSDDLRNAWS